MIRRKRQNSEIIVDLTGPQGNAFFLLGMAQDLGKQLGYEKEDLELLRKHMTESDYENLIKVFDQHFGQFVILER